MWIFAVALLGMLGRVCGTPNYHRDANFLVCLQFVCISHVASARFDGPLSQNLDGDRIEGAHVLQNHVSIPNELAKNLLYMHFIMKINWKMVIQPVLLLLGHTTQLHRRNWRILIPTWSRWCRWNMDEVLIMDLCAALSSAPSPGKIQTRGIICCWRCLHDVNLYIEIFFQFFLASQTDWRKGHDMWMKRNGGARCFCNRHLHHHHDLSSVINYNWKNSTKLSIVRIDFRLQRRKPLFVIYVLRDDERDSQPFAAFNSVKAHW